MRDDWPYWAGPAQKPPPGDWRTWVFLGGRGAGKTRAGAEWVSAEARTGRAGRIALIAPTFHDVREVMVEGASGLRAPPGVRPIYESSRRRLLWPNGAQAYCFSAEDPEALRGPQFDAAWADELWEIVQARTCTLVGPNEYELSNFLRGQLGSAHAMGAPHPIGARIVKLDGRLARADVAAHEWREALTFVAPPAGAPSSDARAAAATLVLPHAASRPWAPAHVRAQRLANDDVTISWIRCARSGGDFWGEGEPPLGAPNEAYRLEILDGSTVKRALSVSAPEYLYEAVDQVADFGELPASLRVRVAQIDASGASGLNTELTITL